MTSPDQVFTDPYYGGKVYPDANGWFEGLM